MSLAELHIHHLRNMTSNKFTFHPHLNFIIGNNGAGKTTLLEAIYLLATGRSFRTRENLPLISQGETTVTLFTHTLDEQSICIQKTHHQPAQARLNGQPCQTTSELARFLPCQVFYQDTFQFIDSGPSARRHVIDWGLFHVKHHYHTLWKQYKRALKQRNALLKQRVTQSYMAPWNHALADLSEQLHQLREAYINALIPIFNTVLHQLSDLSCTLQYYKGWDKRETGKTLQHILHDNHDHDLARQFTLYGAHQADLYFVPESLSAKHYLSRGQQKMVLFALKFAQAQGIPKACVHLFDDVTSELDANHIERLFNWISQCDGQFFITMTSQAILPSKFIDNGNILLLNS